MTAPVAPKTVAFLFLGVALVAVLSAGLLLVQTSTSAERDDVSAQTVSVALEGQNDPDRILTPFRPDEGWEILEPVATLDIAEDPWVSPQPMALPDGDIGPVASGSNRGTGTLVVITNFTRAEVTINGEPYPDYSEDGQNRGVRLPARAEHEVRVNFDGRQKIYRLTLVPGERRLLMVELTGMRASGEPAPAPAPRPRPIPDEELSYERVGPERGQVTVYSRPQGTIYIGDREMGEDTPGTVEVEEGRHEVKVRYEDGQMSETKVVRVREGSRIKLFFRQDEE
jgi:hypothetical protein